MHYGFDIGGTKIAFCVFNAQHVLQTSERVATPHDNYGIFLDTLVALVEGADQRFGSQGTVGVGLPGILREDGRLYAANLPAASGQRLHADLENRLKRRVVLANDANCFALAEYYARKEHAYPVVMGLTLGTGVGGGLVIQGRPVEGKNTLCGEFGHMRLPVDALEIIGRDAPLLACGCGKQGCIERYLSGGGFAWLWAYFNDTVLTSEEIVARYQQGDPAAEQHMSRYTELLAACLGSLLTAIDPDLLVIGGGLSNIHGLTAGLSARLPDYLLPVANLPQIDIARYGDAGGVRGAALLPLVE